MITLYDYSLVFNKEGDISHKSITYICNNDKETRIEFTLTNDRPPYVDVSGTVDKADIEEACKEIGKGELVITL